MAQLETREIALAIVRRARLWLIDQRQTADSLAGLWEFPGGKIRAAETAAQAAVRECSEEVSIIVQPVGQLDTIEHAYDQFRVRLHPVLCRHVEGEARPATQSVAQVRWVDGTTLKQLPMPAANRPLVEALLRLEAGGQWDE
jgi:8-oxo-dGTP diphosphatase